MKNIQNKINVLLHNYQPGEFLPIYEDGQLANRDQFIKYKLHALIIKKSLV